MFKKLRSYKVGDQKCMDFDYKWIALMLSIQPKVRLTKTYIVCSREVVELAGCAGCASNGATSSIF